MVSHPDGRTDHNQRASKRKNVEENMWTYKKCSNGRINKNA